MGPRLAEGGLDFLYVSTSVDGYSVTLLLVLHKKKRIEKIKSTQKEEELQASSEERPAKEQVPEGPVGGRRRARPAAAAGAGENRGIPRPVFQGGKGELIATPRH